ncbi:MAG: choice-of-anchor D domain-containing protein [Myxococcota bacterium]
MNEYRFRSLVRPALLISAFSLGACDDSPVSSVAGELETTPLPGELIEFDDWVLQRTDEVDFQTVEVRNVGGVGIQFTRIAIEGANGSQFRITDAPSLLNPGQTDAIFIRFEPEVHGLMEAELVLQTNDRENPELRFRLQGDARDPCDLVMEPPVQSFVLGETRRVRLASTSNSECVVTALTTASPYFELIDPPQLPFSIPARDTAEVSVLHGDNPLQAGVPTAQLIAIDSDGGRGTVRFEGQAPLAGCLEITPRDLIYPGTPLGSFTTLGIRIVNTCEDPIRIRNVTIPFGDESYSIPDPNFAGAFSIAGLETVVVPVRFTPIIADAVEGQLFVLSEDANNLRTELFLFGRGEPPIAAIFPDELDFGEVTFRNPVGQVGRSECSSATREVFVFSQGNAPLTVSNLEVEEEGDELFSIQGVFLENGQDSEPVVDIESPIRVNIGQNLRIVLQFFPTSVVEPEHEATLRIEHDGEQRLNRILLTGFATPDIPVFDEFRQAPGPQVDLLWVIDDSCSMIDEQLRLVDNLEGFTQFADSQSADYQMAVVTTLGTGSTSGQFERCFPHPRVISGTYFDRAEAFRCTFQVGTNGSGIEAGMAAARNALIRASSDNPGTNAGFLREDADLAVVIMSDEDDFSVESDRLFANFFDTIKGPGRADDVKVHAIAGPVTEPCPRDGFFDVQEGFRYFRLVESTGGIFFNICEEDWSPILTQLGLDTFQPRDQFGLSKVADPLTLQVFVDGLAVSADAIDGYEYDSRTNLITFNGSSVPGPGARVEVTYSDVCSP